MQIFFDKNVLLDAIAPAMGCVSNKNTLSAIEGIMITTDSDSSCTLTAYDLEKGYRTAVPARVRDNGQYIINAVKLNQIVRVMPDGEISIEVDDKCLCTVSGGNSRFELHCLPGTEFPALPDLSGEAGFEISEGALRKMITQTSFAVAVNDTRAALNGLYFEIKGFDMTSVGCDGNRMAKRSCKNAVKNPEKDAFSFIIPSKPTAELVKLLSDDDEKTVKVNPSRKHVLFTIGDFSFFSRLIDSEYLEYGRFIPQNSKTFVTVGVAPLIQSLERAALVTEERTMGQTKSPVKCLFSGGILKVSSTSVTSSVSDELPVKMEGDDIDIGFNCRFLLDAVRCADTESIKLSLTSPLMSMVVEPEDCSGDVSFLFLVLPVRI
ncbi:MAG: DNA polymerase III subunit beta [Eubacteriales bacterium]